jgi:predicted acyltransferase
MTVWGLQFPIVKNIWTSSYVLVCGGLGALLLGVFHQVIDAWGRRSWATAFIWIGAASADAAIPAVLPRAS